MYDVRLEGADRVIKRLSDLPMNLRREVRPRAKQVVEIVATEARGNASWSSRIPGAISTSVTFAATARFGGTVRVDSVAAPHARPYEGMSGNATFRHPVFGGPAWVSENTRPFLKPAGQAKTPEAVRLMGEALTAAINKT